MGNSNVGGNATSRASTSQAEPENERHALGGRLREAREALGLSRGEAAQQVKVSLSTFQAWEAGEREPDATKVATYARRYGLSLDWLLYGEGEMKKDAAPPQRVAASAAATCIDTLGQPVDLDEFVFVPRYSLKAAAGHGAWPEEESPRFSMAFRRYWIVHYLRADPAQLSVIAVKGDSMEGVLNDRDVILINHADREAMGGVYVLRIDGHLVVKRVQRLPGGKLEVSSANEAYKPFTIDLTEESNDFEVIGRVVWFGRHMA